MFFFSDKQDEYEFTGIDSIRTFIIYQALDFKEEYGQRQ